MRVIKLTNEDLIKLLVGKKPVFPKYASIKAKRIEYLISEHLDTSDNSGMVILDVGSGLGHLATKIFKKKFVLGIELNKSLVTYAKKKYKKTNFILGSATHIPLPSFSVDVVIMNHLIEHVPRWEIAIDESARVLKPNGVLYLAFPNYFYPIEPHYKIPFLHMIPSQKIRETYVRFCSKYSWTGDYIRIPQKSEVITSLKKNFNVIEATAKVFEDITLLEEYESTLKLRVLKIFKKIGIVPHLTLMTPTYILLGIKKRIPNQAVLWLN